MKRPKGRGIVREAGDPGFDAAVLATSFNGRDPGHRPKVLIEANDVFEVIEAVKRTRRENLKLSICSGGHSWAQNHIRDNSLLLSMARLNKLEIDVTNKRVIVGPGCWSIDLDSALKKHGLFFPVAHAPDVCLGGFLLQGGFGWGGPKFGLACENVVAIDVVLADGSLVHANAEENSDLYWAARGAGPGFFGVVVRFHLRLYDHPKVTAMKIQIFHLKHLEAVYTWADQVGPGVPNNIEFQLVMTTSALGIFKPGIEVFVPVFADSWQEAKQAVSFIDNSPLRSKASLTLPLIPSSTTLMARIADFTHFPSDVNWCTDNMWTDAPIEDLLPGLRQIGETMPPAPSHSLWLNWNAHENRPDMAFNLEAKRYLAVYGEWRTAADDAKYANWATERMQAMAPFSQGIQLADENLGRRPARFTSDDNMRRLDQIRLKYDPEGLFNSWMSRPE